MLRSVAVSVTSSASCTVSPGMQNWWGAMADAMPKQKVSPLWQELLAQVSLFLFFFLFINWPNRRFTELKSCTTKCYAKVDAFHWRFAGVLRAFSAWVATRIIIKSNKKCKLIFCWLTDWLAGRLVGWLVGWQQESAKYLISFDFIQLAGNAIGIFMHSGAFKMQLNGHKKHTHTHTHAQ